MEITIRRNCENSQQAQKQIAEIAADAYWEEISQLCNDRAKMIAAMQGGYHVEYFYIAYEGDNAVGVAACCPPGHRAIEINPERMRCALGDELGQVAGEIMQNEFGTPHDFGPDSGYIEFVGTAKCAQGKGVATALTKNIMETAPYKRLVLEVADTNTVAIGLYTKLGFTEFERVAEPASEQTGINHRIYMEYVR